MADIDEVMKLVPGKVKLNLHASYAIFDNENPWVDRDKIEPRHFKMWVDFCKERGLCCDFNPTFFSHSKCDPLTLSSPNEETRKFWIEHGKACIRISEYLAKELGQPCVMNIWTGDGFKDIPADRMGPRERYRDSIDELRTRAGRKEVYTHALGNVYRMYFCIPRWRWNSSLDALRYEFNRRSNGRKDEGFSPCYLRNARHLRRRQKP